MNIIKQTDTYTIFINENAENITNPGDITIRAKVKGFWAGEQMSVWFSRQKVGTDINWIPKVSTAAGGRDTDEVASDLEAYTNFAQALNEMLIAANLIVAVS
ncbi:MAG: hypothetical protein JHC38_01805 [Thiotrichales bacterium]|nr:hypothetical protein [Thiotrichales bacterium]